MSGGHYLATSPNWFYQKVRGIKEIFLDPFATKTIYESIPRWWNRLPMSIQCMLFNILLWLWILGDIFCRHLAIFFCLIRRDSVLGDGEKGDMLKKKMIYSHLSEMLFLLVRLYAALNFSLSAGWSAEFQVFRKWFVMFCAYLPRAHK